MLQDENTHDAVTTHFNTPGRVVIMWHFNHLYTAITIIWSPIPCLTKHEGILTQTESTTKAVIKCGVQSNHWPFRYLANDSKLQILYIAVVFYLWKLMGRN